VVPGDYIFAERSGAVVIPAEDLEWAIEEARAIERSDRDFIERIRFEKPGDVLHKGSRES
jgi:regulator of RNase E activity RraA